MAVVWEYDVYFIPFGSGPSSWIIDMLRQRGESGWELVGVASIPPVEQVYIGQPGEPGRVEYYFKQSRDLQAVPGA